MIPKNVKKLTDTTWEYRGVTITFNPSGANFKAGLGKRVVAAPSLDAMVKKLDTNAEFDAFDAYVEENGWQAKREVDSGKKKPVAQHSGADEDEEHHYGLRYLFPVRIVGFDRKDIRYIDEDGGLHRDVIKAGDGVVEAWKNYWDAMERKQAAIKRVTEQFDAEIADYKSKLIEIKAKEHKHDG